MRTGPVFHVTLEPEDVGASLALMMASEQAAALKAFCSELRKCCGTNFRAEMQLHAANDFLSKEDRELLACLGMPRDSE